MNYLAVDTSGKNLTILICKEDKVYKYYDSECGHQHSTTLMPQIEKLASEVGFDFKKADFFSAVVGAGSFTGIRIGVSTVKAMCFAYNKPCLAITSFDTLAYNDFSGKVLAIIDAKHNGFYVCGYENGKVCLEPSYVDRSVVENLLSEYTGVAIEEIDGLDIKKVDIADGLNNAIIKNLDRVTNELESLSPLYVRKSQAEEGR
ncbi:MAG: tRNA (adenosine(37)-N6)-threonylcarbamoyltransferase complex dimerization subunit type 1 TsaB [Clostridiales bacterium]|nr:tRNA (adenosine(37)-N6)-threonylcarbamoyltransferase complex dimerization subunit type 1 TsaB [Clostridiales bacterium]